MTRKSTAVWRGDALHGGGALTTQSGAFREQPHSESFTRHAGAFLASDAESAAF